MRESGELAPKPSRRMIPVWNSSSFELTDSLKDLAKATHLNPGTFPLLFYLCSFQKMKVTWRSRLWKISPMTWAQKESQHLCPTRSSQKSLMPALGALGHDPGFLAGDSARGLSLVSWLVFPKWKKLSGLPLSLAAKKSFP